MAMKHPATGTWASITLIDGTKIDGEIVFDHFGTLGVHPGFYHGNTWYPLHAVASATR